MLVRVFNQLIHNLLTIIGTICFNAINIYNDLDLFTGTSFVTIWALFLPKVNHSLYFHRNKELSEDYKIQHQLNGITVPDDAYVSYLYLIEPIILRKCFKI